MMPITQPNFLLVGAAKAGTTVLYHALRQHPQIGLPGELKETFFFSGLTIDQFPGPGGAYARRAITDWATYTALFEETALFSARGEACGAYLYYHHRAIPRIVERLGEDVRIVISLRNPIDRAYSNYLHHVRDGIEPLPFEEALVAAPRRDEAGWWWGFQYIDVGRYDRQVGAYLDRFGRERVHVIRYDDLEADAPTVLRGLFAFLGVDPAFVPDVSRRYNVSGVPRSEMVHTLVTRPPPLIARVGAWMPNRTRRRLAKALRTWNLVRPPMHPETRRSLHYLFEEDVLKLGARLGWNLSDWLNA